MKNFKLEIVTPDGLAFSGEVATFRFSVDSCEPVCLLFKEDEHEQT